MATDVREKILKSDTLNENLVDRAIRHQIFIQRYGTSLANRIIDELEKVQPDLVRILTERLMKIHERGFDSGPVTTRRLRRLFALIDETVALHNGAAYRQLTLELRQFSKQEGFWQAGLATAEAPTAVTVEMLMPSASLLNAVVTSDPFRGKHLRTWFGDLTRKQKANIKATVNAGLIEGEGVEQIVRRIIGTRAQKYSDGILDATRAEARMVVRTAANHVSNASRAEVNKANEDIIKGEKIIATLDTRTSPICRVQDGKVYPVGKGPRPPFHPNCRSTVVPVLKSWKEMGIDLKQAPKGTRAAMDGSVPEDVTYPQWLKKQNASTQREVLGATRYKKYKSGEISDITRFSDPTGKLYTLPQLARVESQRTKARRSAVSGSTKRKAKQRTPSRGKVDLTQTYKKGDKVVASNKVAEIMSANTSANIDVPKMKTRLGGESKQWTETQVKVSDLKGNGDASKAAESKGPIVALADGTIVDGKHRAAAAAANGQETISAYVPIKQAGKAKPAATTTTTIVNEPTVRNPPPIDSRRAKSGEEWDKVLSDPEKESIQEWKDDATAMRKIISGDKATADLFPRKARMVDDFNSANIKSPVHDGVAYRGLRFENKQQRDDFASSMSSGMTEGSVSSFTKSEDVARKFTGAAEQSVVLKVNMRRGNDISRYNAREQEVLNNKGAQYRTLRVTANEGEAIVIEMEEID
jgi:SPP1 gp7 family putative phage head morphogenesis protein